MPTPKPRASRSITRPKARQSTRVSAKNTTELEAASLDRFDLYEFCVQSPAYDAKMLSAIHGGTGRRSARVLGEDFCGPAAICRAWIDLSQKHHTAVAVDRDAPTLSRAISMNAQSQPGDPRSVGPERSGVLYILDDVRNVRDRVDILCALNYSICELHRRTDLVGYLLNARKRLTAGGTFVCDIYAGFDSTLPGTTSRTMKHPSGATIVYHWEQREADPLTGMVENAIHFDIKLGKGKVERLRDAYVYHWRLWTIPELREAMSEAGFVTTAVYPRQAEAIDDQDRFHVLPVHDASEFSDSFNCYVVGRIK